MIIKHKKKKPNTKTSDGLADLAQEIRRHRFSWHGPASVPHATPGCPVRAGARHSVGADVTTGRRTREWSEPKDRPAGLLDAGRSSPPAALWHVRHDGTSELPGRPEGAEPGPRRAPTWGARTGKPKLVPKDFVCVLKTREGL